VNDTDLKTVFRYDAGGSGFKKAAIFLLLLAGLMAVFAIYWLTSFLGA
jgi:hypothetical protein|tara:strand:+ start:343 stop:486 length:144 start_codon:yes stop_codon:yes gene_type:complete